MTCIDTNESIKRLVTENEGVELIVGRTLKISNSRENKNDKKKRNEKQNTKYMKVVIYIAHLENRQRDSQSKRVHTLAYCDFLIRSSNRLLI